jgi:hypothetical protein
MAYPKVLNTQYKAEKAAGTTDAISFKSWLSAHNTPTAAEALTIAEEALVAIEQVIFTQFVPETQLPDTKTKAQHARQLYDAEEAKATTSKQPLVRKNIIELFMSVVGLTKPGASTYYQNIRKAKGLIS